jgi:hypothetical protein
MSAAQISEAIGGARPPHKEKGPGWGLLEFSNQQDGTHRTRPFRTILTSGHAA